MQSLSNELLRNLLGHLDIQSVVTLSLTCRNLYERCLANVAFLDLSPLGTRADSSLCASLLARCSPTCLERADLSHTLVSDSALAILARMPALKQVDLMFTPRVTTAACAFLSRKTGGAVDIIA